MQRIPMELQKGLTAYQIKLIALFFMTLDHLAVYAPYCDRYYFELRRLGRIAAPLFFFVLTESVRYTRNRPRFLLRLYVGAVVTGILSSVSSFVFGDYIEPNNILFTFFFTASYIILIEEGIAAWRGRNWKKLGLLALICCAVTCVPTLLWMKAVYFPPEQWNLSPLVYRLLRDLLYSLFSSPVWCEYGPVFILMGILMYFAPTKYAKTGVLIAFCAVGYFSNKQGVQVPIVSAALHKSQCFMVMAAPFMLLYNGQKGKESKWLFYAYYPLHRIVMIALSPLLRLFGV